MKGHHIVMSDQKVRRWTAAFGIAAFVVFLAALPLYFLGPSMVLAQDPGFADYVTKASSLIVTRATLADPLIISCFLVFLAGFRHLIRQARPDYEWVSTLVFGAGLLYVTLQLVGDALQGAGALDAAVGSNPSVVRALFEGSVPLYGSIGLIPGAFFLAFAGYAASATGVLPKWIGWVAYVGAAIMLADAPTIYMGFSGLTSGAAAGVAAVAEFWSPVWAFIASISLIRRREVAKPQDEGDLEAHSSVPSHQLCFRASAIEATQDSISFQSLKSPSGIEARASSLLLAIL